VAISLMQELEHTRPKGIVVATSNLPEQLDDALFRRFDEGFEFPRPSHGELMRFGLLRARTGGISSSRTVSRVLAGASSYADVVRRIAAEERAVALRKLTGRE